MSLSYVNALGIGTQEAHGSILREQISELFSLLISSELVVIRHDIMSWLIILIAETNLCNVT